MNKKNIIPIFSISVVVLLVGAALVYSDFSLDVDKEKKQVKKPSQVFESKVIEKNKEGEEIFKKDFSDFNDIKKYSGDIADIKFASTTWSKKVTTTISKVVDRGPTFAGKYTVVTYVCGKECQRSTIVNVETGEVVADGLRSVYDVSYRLNSRLFIVNPKKNLPKKTELKEGVSTDYYVLQDGQMRFVGKQSVSNSKDEVCAQVVTTAENKATGQELSFPTSCDVPKFGWVVK